ncbi:MAG: hypothetical protein EBR67_03545 [Proteobacteria bacterium]|nr:hypothetical protein [Pseudomonadota bacterium]
MAKLKESEWKALLDRVKNGGLSVSQASEEYGIHANTIYKRLSRSGTPGVDLLKMRRLEKENSDLKIILAEAMLVINREKKD